ncbi:aldo/keto reductase [Epibacterium sp. Ofav1-8]|uniref:aldo/keto reductase n=1 Tax=Epibacterium sp. Ofav1-8 TaxID=2917735 RepID=UPI001EF66C24|nr:aldo/keto reductase [Epibacterium sp. Ofav1-8]MCG7625090.1 aldo/keto reductase [Epibacterium sp. Ofav1-8]
MNTRELGQTGAHPSCVGMGGVTLGEIYAPVPDHVARATLEAAWDSGIRYFDTSPWYGHGLSELRFGEMLRSKPRQDFVLSTKIGRTFFRPQEPETYRPTFWKGGLPFDYRFDYTYDGIMRSYEQSMMRLGINSIDLLLIHDLDVAEIGSQDLVDAHFRDLEKSGWRALEMLRTYGEIKGIGAGVNILGTIPEMLRRFDLDFFLVAMPYTLLDQEVLEAEFPACAARDVGIVIGSPFASGILATGTTVETPFYNYVPAEPEMVAKVRAIEGVCHEFDVPLKAAAFQFPLLNPIVATVVSGAGSPEQARENAALLDVAIPRGFWTRLRDLSLIHPDSLPEVMR